jgi:hypothetical protein
MAQIDDDVATLKTNMTAAQAAITALQATDTATNTRLTTVEDASRHGTFNAAYAGKQTSPGYTFTGLARH